MTRISVDPSLLDPSKRGRLRLLIERGSLISCWLIPLLALVLSLRHVRFGWDDGAITAAFARTFAHTGRIALTPSSEQVEGFSSLLWMMILAAAYKVVHSVWAMLAWTKIASAIAFSLALFSFRRLAVRFVDAPYVPFAVLLLAFTITPFTEVINGMEMNLYMFLTLYLTELLLDEGTSGLKGTLACLVSVTVLTTRFESPFLLLILYAGALWVTRQRMLIGLMVLGDALFLVGMEVWRGRMFGDFVPNTIRAKRWAPYAVSGLHRNLWSRVDATQEIVTVLCVPLFFLAAFWIATKIFPVPGKRYEEHPSCSAILWFMSAGAILLGLGMGQNWGHPGRMVLAFLPFIILLVVFFYQSLEKTHSLLRERMMVVVVLIQLGVWASSAYGVIQEQRTSYARVERTGIAAEKVREALGLRNLSVFIPDVGGSSLCCEDLDVMDSALLANHFLAKKGYAGTKEFVQVNRPDLIEVHEPWSSAGSFYEENDLDGYNLVGVNGMFAFLRSDLYQRLLRNGYHEIRVKGNLELCGDAGSLDGKKSSDLIQLFRQPVCIHIVQSHN
jgi:hypothetical protein